MQTEMNDRGQETMGNLPCLKKSEDKDSAWKNQNRDQEANKMYMYCNLQKGGLLVDKYVEEGPEALVEYISKEIEPMLYNSGKGMLVEKIHWVRWLNESKARSQDVSLVDVRPDEQVLAEFRDSDFTEFEEHTACWDFNMRGTMGETVLHLCCLLNTPVHTDIAKLLLSKYPKMAGDIYEGEEYYGEGCLHIAIVYGDFEMVRLLVEKGANVKQRATGLFFLPEDQKRGRTKSSTNYEGYAYYGEYPLAFATCFGHEEIYDYLIDHGAEPNAKDSFGNTVLHMAVISNQIGMFSYAVKHHASKANMTAVNDSKMTPLTLASKLGRNEIFKEIIELQSIEIWRYSNITCSTYPLGPIDTIGPDGKTNEFSALKCITDGDTEDHLEMLGGGVIKQLLDEKWKNYARRRFIERLVVAVLHLIILSIAIYTRPPDRDLLKATDSTNIVRYIAEIIVCLDCLTTIVLQITEVVTQGMGVLKNLINAPAKFIFFISCVLILLCIPFRFTRMDDVEMVLLAAAAPCAWAHLLFYCRGLSLLGPFVIMIYKMCATDIVRFVLIYTIFLVQFTLGFYFLFRDIVNSNIQTFATPGGTIMQLFQMTLGEFRYEEFDDTRMPLVTKMVFFAFAVLVPILLLNMLIAMMGNTYQMVISRSEKEWKRQWAKIVLVLERTFSKGKLLQYQSQYSVPLDKGQPGLMVIKTSAKTKARQRKGAISNWKRLVNEIKSLIKEQKRGGKAGILDLTSSEVSQKITAKRLRKRRSDMYSDDVDGAPASTEGLLNAMTQLAWEKDIDLATPRRVPQIPEHDMLALEESIAFSTDTTSLIKKGQSTKEGIDNPAVFSPASLNRITVEPAPTPDSVRKSEHLGMKDLGKAKRTAKVNPEPSKKPPIGGPAVGKDTDASRKSAGTKRNGSGNSKDSAYCEEKLPLKKGSRESSHASASSLTSLLQAWDEKDKDKPK